MGACLDKVSLTLEWRNKFEDATVVHLAKMKSDHSPLWTRTHPYDWKDMKARPFCILAPSVLHDDFPRVVKEAWSGSSSWFEGLDKFHESIHM